MKKLRLLFVLIVTSVGSLNQTLATVINYSVPGWSESPITFEAEDENPWKVNSYVITSPSVYGGETSLTGTVTTNGNSTLDFGYCFYWYGWLDVHVDDNLALTIEPGDGAMVAGYQVPLTSGTHTIKFTFRKDMSDNTGYAILSSIGVRKSGWTPHALIPADKIVSGNQYQVKNVESGMFLAGGTSWYSWATSAVLVDPSQSTPLTFTLTQDSNNGGWAFARTSDNLHTFISGSMDGKGEMHVDMSRNQGHDYFEIIKQPNGYFHIRAVATDDTYGDNMEGYTDKCWGWEGAESTYPTAVYATVKPSDGYACDWEFYDDTQNAKARQELHQAIISCSKYPAIDLSDALTLFNSPTATVSEMDVMKETLNSKTELSDAIAKHELHDYPICLMGDGWKVGRSGSSSNKTSIYKVIDKNDMTELHGYVIVDKESCLYYKTYSHGGNMEVYIDDVLVRNMTQEQISNTYSSGYFDHLNVGTHHVVWKYRNTNSNYSWEAYIESIGVIATPLVAVELFEPGSLGTEVLYNVDHVKDVRNLKIKGVMNSDDWAKIDMMTNLFALDLSEANITSIPELAFSTYKSSSYSRKESAKNLYRITLPNQLESIGKYAFYNSLAENFDIPSSVTQIGESAFYYSRIRRANLEHVTDIATSSFSHCYLLSDITLSENLKTVGSSAFVYDYSISSRTISFPLSIEKIEASAFSDCHNINFRFPDKDISFGGSAFYSTAIDSLILYRACSGATNNTYSAFYGLSNLVYAEFSTETIDMNVYYIFYQCPKLNTIVLKSPTVVGVQENTFNSSSYLVGELPNITLRVPSFAVNSYKLHSFWYNAKKIEGFNTSEIKDWTIRHPLVLNARDRFEGEPNLTIQYGTGSLKINGDATQQIDNLYIDWSSQLWANCDNVSINGTYTHCYGVTANTWHFITLPCDIRVGDIWMKNGSLFAIRYYDGASRAANGTGQSWKDFDEDDIIPAGTGFILQANKDDYAFFTALENDTKQRIVSNQEIETTLAVNATETAANRGWNLVGNPWQTYYNIHKMNFTAPITVYNSSSKKYEAYSIIDDDYALAPNQAFFVQCPNAEQTIVGFPVDGRQLTSEITSQNGVKAEMSTLNGNVRSLIDLELTDGELTDRTRLVVNENALADYEPACDACKFLSDANVPQIYTLDNEGTQYAINERPLGESTVGLGMTLPTQGLYTISVTRNDLVSAVLVDYLMGTETELTTGLTYTFNASAGVADGRFALRVKTGTEDGIDEIAKNEANESETIYDLSGRRVSQMQKGGVYVVRRGGKSMKIAVK